MTDLIDPEGRCERCGRLVPIECPEPDGLSCGAYVAEIVAGEREPTAVLLEHLGDSFGRAAEQVPLTERPAVIFARALVLDGGEIRGPALVVTGGAANAGPAPDLDVPPDEPPTLADLGLVFTSRSALLEAALAVPVEPADPTPQLPPANEAPDTPEEIAFFAAMDDLVEHVTGTRPGARGCEADDQGGEDGRF